MSEEEDDTPASGITDEQLTRIEGWLQEKGVDRPVHTDIGDVESALAIARMAEGGVWELLQPFDRFENVNGVYYLYASENPGQMFRVDTGEGSMQWSGMNLRRVLPD